MTRERLQITCLGKTEIRYADEPLSPSMLKKGQALLIYLALEKGRHPRSKLAGLLWSDMEESRARANLRTALNRMPQVVRPYLTVTRRAVGFDPSPGCWIDAQAVEQKLSDPSSATQREALAHYKGDFLDGLALANATVFEEWALVRQEHLRALVLEGLSDLAQEALAQGETVQAIADLRRLLILDPWREAAHRALMRAWAASGDRAAALAQFEECQETLVDELGVEPAPATVALYEQIKAGKYVVDDSGDRFNVDPAAGRSPPANHNLPAETTPFVGRQAELAQISERLAEAGCRLLTLYGPGGTGKTRLALHAARRAAGHFGDGVCLVSLETVEAGDQLPTAIATALKIPLSGRREPRAQLLAYLLEREMLLVLDNFEHLLPETSLLTDILESAPGVKMLATSLHALKLYEEWLLAIEGLPHPTVAAVDDLTQFDAVNLFQQRARQVQADFDLAGNETGVLTICRLLQGMPLGIELAAAAVRARSPAQIARQIEADLSTLATTLQNVPARHRSMVAVFDYAWRLLQAEDRRLLRRLTVFRGSFSATAVREAFGVAQTALDGLVDRSMLQVTDSDRYHIHPLIRHFSAAKLAAQPEEQSAAQASHAAYYAALLKEQEKAVSGAQQQRPLHLIGRELDNVSTAWRTAVAGGKSRYLDQMVVPLYHFFRKQGYPRKGFELFGMAVDALRESIAQDLLARLLIYQGRMGEHISQDFELSERLLREGLALAESERVVAERALALDGLGLLAMMRGDMAQASDYLHDSLALSRQAALSWLEANTLVLVAWLRSGEGKWEEARAICGQALAIHRQSGHESGVASALTALGHVYGGLGQYDEAEGAYAEALALCRQTGHHIGVGQALTGLFAACYHQGNLAQAAEYARESLAVNRDVGDRLGMAIAYHNLGFLAARDGRHREAVDHYYETLAIYETIDAGGARRSNTQRCLADSLLELQETAAAGDHLYQAIQEMPAAAYRQRGAEVMLTGARYLLQNKDEEVAAGIVAYLQQQSLLPPRLDTALSDLLDASTEVEAVALQSVEQGLNAVAAALRKQRGQAQD